MEPSKPDSGTPFDWKSISPTDEHYQLALQEYHGGRSFPEIVAILEHRRVSPDLIPDVVTALAKDRAFYMLSAGKSVGQVRDTLAERGLRSEDADYIARLVGRAREKTYSSLGVGKWRMRSLAAGGILLTGFMILYGLKRLSLVDVPGELLLGFLVSGVLLAALGGVYVAFGARIG